MNAPGWQPDPTTRHEYRYWDGSQWTDDVSDGGVTSVDPVDGSGAAAAGGYPSSDATQAMDPATQAYGGPPPPGAGTPPPGVNPSYQGYGADPYGQSYGGGSGQMPPGQPAKKGPNPALIIGIAVVVLLLLGGGAFALLSGDDGDDDETSAGTTTTTAAETTTTTSAPETTTTTEATTTTTEEDAGSGASDDSLVPLIAEGIQQSAPELTDEQAECIAQVIIDEVGVEQLAEIGASGDTSDAFSQLTSEQQAALATAMLDCAPADVLAGT
jgi:hypothetical protein